MLARSRTALVAPTDPTIDVARSRLRNLVGAHHAISFPDIGFPAEVPGGDAGAQAVSGLMAVHGRDEGRPRRLGLDVPSIAAATLLTQAALAGAFARLRGIPVRSVESSLVAGALAFLHHHLALETCGSELPFRLPPSSPGPPFRTGDGFDVEVEALLGRDWTRFWTRLGVADCIAGDAWLPFVFRFLTGRCALPPELHEAVARRSWAEVRCAAQECALSACRVRSYAEVLDEWAEHEFDVAAIDEGTPFDATPGPSVGGGVEAPLTGIRVVEVTSRLQGPLAALLLRQLGANVVKVEPPGGDFGRRAAPRAGSVGAAYLAYNRLKERVELDYKDPAGRRSLLDLAAGADVFLQNWPAGRAEALGLDGQALTRVNPAMVYAHAAGWHRGSDGPCRIASDYVVQAHAATGDGLYPLGDRARPSRLTLVDAMGGLLACEAILAGLCRRELDRRGQRVETSLLGAAMTLQAPVLAAMRHGRETGRAAGRPVWDALDEPLEASNGFLFAGPLEPGMRRRLARVAGVPGEPGELDPAAVAVRFRERPVADWRAALDRAGIPAVVVCGDLGRLPADPVAARWVERIDDGCWAPGAPWRFRA